MRALACLIVLGVSVASASAEPSDGDTCDGVAPRAQLARYDLLGDGAVHVVTRAGDHYVVYPHGCAIYPLAAAVARVDAKLGYGIQAYALRPQQCSQAACPTIVAVRGKSARAVLALRTGLDCDVGAELRAVKRRHLPDAVLLTCRHTGAPDVRIAYEATVDGIAPLDAGSAAR